MNGSTMMTRRRPSRLVWIAAGGLLLPCFRSTAPGAEEGPSAARDSASLLRALAGGSAGPEAEPLPAGPGGLPDGAAPPSEPVYIDKGRIADETVDRLIGLRESGNPHLGEGLLIRQLEEDLSRSRIDTARLREERIRVFETRRDPVADLREGPRTDGPANDGAQAASALTTSRPPPETAGGLGPVGKGLLGAAALVVLGGILAWRRR